MRKYAIGEYRPLIVVIFVVFLTSLVIQFSRTSWQAISWMHDFMGLFLIVFSIFKLFDISGFAKGFAMYDIIAGRFKAYGFTYPFIELLMGLAYLGRIWLFEIYIITLAVMAIGSIGVIRAVVKGLDIRCACLGTVLKTPLSTVAIVEDVGMGLMALVMLIAS